MTAQYEQQAHRAIELLETSGTYACDPWIITEIFTCAALVADGQQVAVLSVALELFDVRQHLALSTEEIAASVSRLVELGLIERRQEMLVLPDEVWRKLPRTNRGELDRSRTGLSRWQSMVDGRSGSVRKFV